MASALKLGTFSAVICRKSYSHLKISSSSGVNKYRTYMTKTAHEPFLNGSSSVYVEEMYKAWLKDPESVHKVSLME